MKSGQRGVPTTNEWLCENLSPGDVVGVDPLLISANEAKSLSTELSAKSITLKAVGQNPVDVVWGADQPSVPAGPIHPHPIQFSVRLGNVSLTLTKNGHNVLLQDIHIYT